MTLSTADRLEILDVVARADWAATRRDADAYVQLFTEDAVLDGDQGHHAGREALRASVGPIWTAEGKATLHLTLNPLVEDDGGPEPVARSVLLIIDPDPPVTIRTAVIITQTLRRSAGSWRIARRTVGAAGRE
jgi:ketosteroid isomerase-like protein